MSLFSLSQISVSKVLTVLAIPGALMVSGLFVWNASSAAFSGTTNNGPEEWTAGTVELTNNHASALFSAGTITPGYSETNCITITSTADVPTQLKMYTSAVSSNGPVGAPLLSSHLKVQVVEGSGATNTDGDCTGFVPETTPAFNGTLASFANNSSYANAVGNHTLPAQGSRQYQITVSLPTDAPNTLQKTAAGATFVWEAQG